MEPHIKKMILTYWPELIDKQKKHIVKYGNVHPDMVPVWENFIRQWQQQLHEASK